MRLAAAALASALSLALPLLGEAGEGCPHAAHATANHAKGAVTGHDHVCGESCPVAEERGEHASAECPCAGEATRTHHEAGKGTPDAAGDAGDEVAATD